MLQYIHKGCLKYYPSLTKLMYFIKIFIYQKTNGINIIMNIQKRNKEILAEYQTVIEEFNSEDLNTIAYNIINARKIFLLAAGRSKCVLQMFAMRLTQAGFNVYFTGDTTTPAISAGELLIIASGSGKTISVLAMAEKAKTAQAKINVFTASLNTRLTEMSDFTLTLATDKKKNSQVLGNLFEASLMLTCDLIIEIIMEKTGQKIEDLAKRHANIE